MINTFTRRQMVAIGGAAALAPYQSVRAAPSRGELRQDIDILRRALALHPGLYRYQSPRQSAARLRTLDRDYAAAATLEQQFLILAAFTATIRCGHTQCNPYNQKNAVVQALFERPTRLPFAFDWIGGRMAVLVDHSELAMPRGTEILSIDGEVPARLLSRLIGYARADGSNHGKRVAQMAMLDTDRFETFDIFQGLLLPPGNGLFRIRYRIPSGQERAAAVTAMTAQQRRGARHTLETGGMSAPLWTWEMKHRVAVLTMPSWVMYNSRWDWQRWLGDRLASLEGAAGLIIDLRGNEGGNECGNAILARLSGRDLRLQGYRQLVRYRRTPHELDPFLDTWDDSFRMIGETAKDLGTGFYDLGEESSDTIASVGPRLDIPVAALIGPICSSATFSFARRAQESGLVRLFGTPSGGNLRGINGNGYFFVRLPGSGLEVDLPIVGNFPQTPQPDRGVVPDVTVKPTIADIATGADPCLRAAIGWIEARR